MDNIRLLWDSNLILPQSLFELLGWILLDPICYIFTTQHLMEHWRVTCRKGSDDQVSKKLSKSNPKLCENEMRNYNYCGRLLFIGDYNLVFT